VRLAADRGVGCSSPASSIALQRVRELGADRRREVLDVGDLDHRRLVGAVDPHRVRRAARGRSGGRRSPAPRGPCRAQQLLAEVVVDGRVGGAADRAGQRDR
jgi:hypothetical protein